MNTGQHSVNSNSNTPDNSGEVLSSQMPNFVNNSQEMTPYSMQSEHAASRQTEIPPTIGAQQTNSQTQSQADNAITATQPFPIPSNQSTPGHSAAPSIAADDDLIEKEWVLRAKAIVAKTKDDPHQQNKELNLYKADYIKKRYNKDIKVSEG